MINIGHIGLGRMGMFHAETIASLNNANLYALCDLNDELLKDTAQRLGVEKTYNNFDDMIEDDNIDAITITSPSFLHTEQISKALKAGKHVFSEKPLGTTVEQCKEAEKTVEKCLDQIFMLGFMRRFDNSYKYAKEAIDNGEIGEVYLVRSYSQDPTKNIEGAIAFGPHSGGEFLDMAVHDIDLMRWYIGSEPKQVWAIGGAYAYPEFKEWNDGDNVSALMKFENDAMGFLFAGRTAPHGYNVETEIMGTKGTIRIGSVPQKNLVEIMDENGIRKEMSQDFIERFAEAYKAEIVEFIRCIEEDSKPETTVYDGTAVSRIAYAAKESFETGKLIDIQ